MVQKQSHLKINELTHRLLKNEKKRVEMKEKNNQLLAISMNKKIYILDNYSCHFGFMLTIGKRDGA